MSKHSVADSHHTMLSNPETNVSTLWCVLLEVSDLLVIGQVGRRKIGRSPNQLGHVRSNLRQAHLTVLSSCHFFVFPEFKSWQLVHESLRKFSSKSTRNFSRLFREGGRVFSKQLFPSLALSITGSSSLGEEFLDIVRDKKVFRFWETKLLFGRSQVVRFERGSMGRLVALQFTSKSNSCLNLNDRRFIRHGFGVRDCGTKIVKRTRNI
mmetsp:Transcript_21276/g.44425  ORF Transcript_21276/g.44425 Transcript_21276/m.44425 type:complete len:209 (+) Transcript_21276:2383-3009(+)